MTLYSLDKIAQIGRGTLSSVRAAGTLFDRHVIQHYLEALGEIRQRGLYATLRQSSQPYIEAVWRNFSSEKTTITEDLLSGKLVGQTWRAARRWLTGQG